MNKVILSIPLDTYSYIKGCGFGKDIEVLDTEECKDFDLRREILLTLIKQGTLDKLEHRDTADYLKSIVDILVNIVKNKK